MSGIENGECRRERMGTSCDCKSNCIEVAVKLPTTGSVINQGQHLLPPTSVARLVWEATHPMDCSWPVNEMVGILR